MPLFTKKKKKRQVSAFPAIFKADFGRFRPVSAAGRYGPILAESTRFGVNRSGFGTNRAESARNREKKKKKKKKHRRRGPTPRQPRRTPRPASRHVRRECSTSGAASVLSSLQGSSGISYAMFTIVS